MAGLKSKKLVRDRMLRIQKVRNGRSLYAERPNGSRKHSRAGNTNQLGSERTRYSLEPKRLTLVNESAVIFLERCESNSITRENCPPYIRKWINRQRQGS